MKKLIIFLVSPLLILFAAGSASALLISGQDIIAAPSSAIDDAPGATNFSQQAFNEMQDVLLTADLSVDAGTILSGTVVDSHMIFLNTPVGQGGATDQNVQWTFDGAILGVMSDRGGVLETSSSALLGAAGTTYPLLGFPARGMEGADAYTVFGNMIEVSMFVSEPGDWIRVVTEAPAPVPEPATMLLFGTGLVGLAGVGRRKFKKK